MQERERTLARRGEAKREGASGFSVSWPGGARLEKLLETLSKMRSMGRL